MDAHSSILAATLVVSAFVCVDSSAGQNDRVTLSNGDRLTGEIKSLDRGKIELKTDATDTIEIKWEYVENVVSTQTFEVTLDDGQNLYAALAGEAAPNQLRLQSRARTIDVPRAQVVRLTPIEGPFLERIEMRVNVGYSLTKANDVSQANAGYKFRYRGRERLVQFDVDASRTLSLDQPSSARANADFSYRRFLNSRSWDPVGIAQFERNDELGIAGRYTLGGGLSRFLTDTNRHRASFTGGIVYSIERSIDSTEQTGDIEGALGVSLDWFRYDYPELDVTTRLSVFERLTGGNRSRGSLNVDFSWELIQDFNLGFGLYYSFDSAPESSGSNTDYGLSTTLGWKF